MMTKEVFLFDFDVFAVLFGVVSFLTATDPRYNPQHKHLPSKVLNSCKGLLGTAFTKSCKPSPCQRYNPAQPGSQSWPVLTGWYSSSGPQGLVAFTSSPQTKPNHSFQEMTLMLPQESPSNGCATPGAAKPPKEPCLPHAKSLQGCQLGYKPHRAAAHPGGAGSCLSCTRGHPPGQCAATVQLSTAQPSSPGGSRAACWMLRALKSALCKGGMCLSLGKTRHK